MKEVGGQQCTMRRVQFNLCHLVRALFAANFTQGIENT